MARNLSFYFILLVFHFFFTLFYFLSFFYVAVIQLKAYSHLSISPIPAPPHLLATPFYSIPEFDFLFYSTLKVIWWWIWWYSFIFLCLAYLSIILSKFTHTVTNDRIFFFLKNILLSFHVFYICSSLGEHSPCFHVLATVNNAAMNMQVQIALWSNDFKNPSF